MGSVEQGLSGPPRTLREGKGVMREQMIFIRKKGELKYFRQRNGLFGVNAA
jgi:hypothetical protein